MTDRTYALPTPIAAALMTGRPEMARIGIKALGDTLTQEQIDELSDYAEAVVREIQAERAIVADMYEQIKVAAGNIKGALNTHNRIQEAFRLMRDNAGPEAVRQAISNPRWEE